MHSNHTAALTPVKAEAHPHTQWTNNEPCNAVQHGITQPTAHSQCGSTAGQRQVTALDCDSSTLSLCYTHKNHLICCCCCHQQLRLSIPAYQPTLPVLAMQTAKSLDAEKTHTQFQSPAVQGALEVNRAAAMINDPLSPLCLMQLAPRQTTNTET
jgi:hypothetical protein